MTGKLAIHHVDLSLPEPVRQPGMSAFNVFWWGDLPLAARMAQADELPLGVGQLRALASELLAEQMVARQPSLGAPLRATHEGRAHQVLTLMQASRIVDPLEQIHDMATPSDASAAHISVIICTRDRGAALTDCLNSIMAQRSPPGEIIVVDNSALASARPFCAPFPDILYVHEPRPGLSVARNAGISIATLELIAFTDDDVQAHPGWLAEMAYAFSHSDAEAMTGLVLPASLDTPAQRFFQFDMGGFGSSFVPILFEACFFAETRPHGAQVWKIGAGANMAFRRSAFTRAGLFDERLGAGASGCSEDSEFWYRLLALGGACLYEPRAVVFHHHRAEWPELKRQIRTYMRGHVSALVAQADAFGDKGNLRRVALQLPAYFLGTLFDCIRYRHRARGAVLAQEVLGWLAGLRYVVSPRWRALRVERPAP